MTLSPIGIDTVELTKRYKYHKNQLRNIIDDPYMSMDEKGFETRSVKVRFHKSLNSRELDFIHDLQDRELGGGHGD